MISRALREGIYRGKRNGKHTRLKLYTVIFDRRWLWSFRERDDMSLTRKQRKYYKMGGI